MKPDLNTLVSRTGFGKWLNENGFTGEGVEVGSLSGGYAREIMKDWNGRRLHLVDPWEPQSKEIYKEDVSGVDWLGCYKECLRFAFEVAPRVNMIRALSVPAAQLFRPQSLDFVYIDGNHSYEAVIEDIIAWSIKIRPGGLLCGHDYWNDPPHGEPKRAVDEFQKSSNIPMHYTPNCGSWWFIKP